MTEPDLVERLAGHKTLGKAPRQEREWLVAHGTMERLKEGEYAARAGQPVEGLYVVLSGFLAHFVDRGAGRHKVMEWRTGEVTGVLPYSRLVNAPGDSIAQEDTEVLVIPKSDLTAMIHECHEVTSILVHTMLDRARVFTSSGYHDEKMASLGRLSAGLAHELNNPASAIERSAALLDGRLEEAEQATRALGASRLTDEQLSALDAVRVSCLGATTQGVLSPIQQAEREDEISDWLSAHGADDALAAPLADTAVTIRALDRLAGTVSGPPLAAVLRWVAAGCAVRGLASEIQEAAMRISGLVQAIKGFTHMDQAPVAEAVELPMNLNNTVTVLKAKAKSKSIAVAVTADPNLPRVRGFVGELNQIWSNLIDNALDAAPQGGRVEVTANVELQRVVVRVIDNGGGIPPELRKNIFEPFFTTKPVGLGTGLGLDIVRRLTVHNDAEIEFDSRPGRTEFRVTLNLADAAPAGAHS